MWWLGFLVSLAGELLDPTQVGLIENLGQWDPRIQFAAALGDTIVRCENQALVCEAVRSATRVRLVFEGADRGVAVSGEQRTAGYHHFFLGRDPARWRTDVRAYRRVAYRDLYPGVSVFVRLTDHHAEYDLECASASALERVRIRCEGVRSLALSRQGELVMHLDRETLVQPPPHTWVVAPDGKPRSTPCHYQLVDATHFRFVVEAAPAARVCIDPGLIWSTVLGGSLDDQPFDVALDSGNHVILAGGTFSVDYPTSPNAYDSTYNGGGGHAGDVCLSKLDTTKTGTAELIYSTYLGGSDSDHAIGLVVNDQDEMFITANSMSDDFPTTPLAYDTTHNGQIDLVQIRMSAAGNALLYSTYLGGSEFDHSHTIALSRDGSNDVTVTGETYSVDFPTTPGAYDTSHGGGKDVFVTRLSGDGSQLRFSTFLGGTLDDMGFPVAIASNGGAIVAGHTYSPDFPTTSGTFDRTFGGNFEGFVARLDGQGALEFASFLGGSADEYCYALDLDPQEAIVVSGRTASPDFPITSGAYDKTLDGIIWDLFVTRVSSAGDAVLQSTFVGGTEWEDTYDLKATELGVTVVGETKSADFPTTPTAFDTIYGGGEKDAFLFRLDATLSTMVYATFVGGGQWDSFTGLVLDAHGQPTVGGWTRSSDYPVTPGAYDTTLNGGQDIVAGRLCIAAARPYGAGWPGTLGIPTLSASDRPVSCATINLEIENARGTATAAVLFVGIAEAALPTSYGGTLWLVPITVFSTILPAGLASLPVTIPCDLCGLVVDLQVLEQDPGASRSVAFTSALQLVIGG